MRLLWWLVGLGAVAGVGVAIATAKGPAASLPDKRVNESVRELPKPKRGGERVLLIGDSLSVVNKDETTLGARLAKKLRASGYDVTVNALGGRSANSFITANKAGKKGKEKKKGLEQLQDHIDDGIETAIVFLGTNELADLELSGKSGTKALDAKLSRTEANTAKIIDKLRSNGVRVIGIGAPHFKERPEFHPYEDLLYDTVRPLYGDDFIDARPITGDYKMHGSGKSAEAFAQALHDILTGVK